MDWQISSNSFFRLVLFVLLHIIFGWFGSLLLQSREESPAEHLNIAITIALIRNGTFVKEQLVIKRYCKSWFFIISYGCFYMKKAICSLYNSKTSFFFFIIGSSFKLLHFMTQIIVINNACWHVNNINSASMSPNKMFISYFHTQITNLKFLSLVCVLLLNTYFESLQLIKESVIWSFLNLKTLPSFDLK